jgi:hypothetical protein
MQEFAGNEFAGEEITVEESTRADLKEMQLEVQRSGLAASALVLARLIDEPGGISARDFAGLAREYRMTMMTLREMGHVGSEGDDLVAGLSTPVGDGADGGT